MSTSDGLAPSISAELLKLGLAAKEITRLIRNHFPIRGKVWPQEALFRGQHYISVIQAACCRFERLCNDTDLPFGDPKRRTLRLCRHYPHLFERPNVVLIADSWADLEDSYNHLLSHYGWEQLICSPHDESTQPWTWPDVPPIAEGCLDAVDHAADHLIQLVMPAVASSIPSQEKPVEPVGETSPPVARHRKPSVNARMLETIQANHEAIGWSSTQWSEHLQCAKSTVVETPTWKNL
ncbi:MAG: hypothetical protein L0312_09270, partial [Acidobacteria bacterium]|nr:hypothetical protein [Acidobacteriota bacterium]